MACTVVILATCATARAEAGLSYLALCQRTWPCAKSLAAFDGTDTIRTGWLEGTFGSVCSCANTFLKDPRPKVIRVHLANGPCLRNGRCGRYEVFYGQTVASANRRIKQGDRRLLSRFATAAKRLARRLASSTAPLTCYVSPVLESDFDREARTRLASITARYLPGCRLVDNPTRGECIRGSLCERHGLFPRLSSPCIADLDGTIASDSEKEQFLSRTSSCDLSFIWTPEMNCNRPNSSSFIDPRMRQCEQSESYYRSLGGWLSR
jgi:hypothetical protein